MISQIFLKHLQKEMERNCKQFHRSQFWSDFTIKDKFKIAEYNSEIDELNANCCAKSNNVHKLRIQE